MVKQLILLSVEIGYMAEFSWLPEVMQKTLKDTDSRIMFASCEGEACYMIVETGNAFALGSQMPQFAKDAMAKTNSCKRFGEYLEGQPLEGELWGLVANKLYEWHETIKHEGLIP